MSYKLPDGISIEQLGESLLSSYLLDSIVEPFKGGRLGTHSDYEYVYPDPNAYYNNGSPEDRVKFHDALAYLIDKSGEFLSLDERNRERKLTGVTKLIRHFLGGNPCWDYVLKDETRSLLPKTDEDLKSPEQIKNYREEHESLKMRIASGVSFLLTHGDQSIPLIFKLRIPPSTLALEGWVNLVGRGGCNAFDLFAYLHTLMQGYGSGENCLWGESYVEGLRYGDITPFLQGGDVNNFFNARTPGQTVFNLGSNLSHLPTILATETPKYLDATQRDSLCRNICDDLRKSVYADISAD
ncbi:MAG: hypothetical protein WC533_04740 [Candidatus Pacearchaeota archaeon]